MKDIISQLNILKEEKPSESWVSDAKKSVMSKAPVFDQFTSDLYNTSVKKSIFDLSFLHQSKIAVPTMMLVFAFFGGSFTLSASQSSLPGDTLYPVKIASENATLAIASPEKKAEIEIEQAGKRLEEWVEISKNTSDVKQSEKLKQLAVDFEEKVNNAQDGLTKIENNEKKAEIAKVINVQTEKYTEVWGDANENLTEVVKNDVSDELASAIDSSKQVNLDSLTVRVEVMTDNDKEEITAIVKEKAEEKAETSEEVKIVKIEKVDIDCSKCEENNKDCLEETDELGNIRCYFEVKSETIIETDDNTRIYQESDIISPENFETKQESKIDEVIEDLEEIQTPLTIDQEKEELLSILDDLNKSDDLENGDDSEKEDQETEDNAEEGAVKGDTEEVLEEITDVESNPEQIIEEITDVDTDTDTDTEEEVPVAKETTTN